DAPVRATSVLSTTSAIDLIDRVARAWPDAMALSADASQSITYGALMTAADALAAELSALGAGPDIPIGICIDRSIEHAVALLGALRAGSCFLLLDPDWPADRLTQVLEDACAPIVIAAPRFMEKLGAPHRTVLSSALEARHPGARRIFPKP